MEPLRNSYTRKTASDDFEVASLLSESESSFVYQPHVSQRRGLRTAIVLFPWLLNAVFITTTLYFMHKSLAKPLDPSQLSYSMLQSSLATDDLREQIANSCFQHLPM
jgi:hypothetical protein